jgi:hypothetical protein
MDAATRRSLMEVGKGAVEKGATEQTKAQLDDALSRTAFLISVSKYDVNRPAPEFNTILMCSAERLPTAVIKTGEDYFNAALHVFDGTSTKVELVGRMRAEMLGGAALTVADMKLTVGARVFAQRCYVRVVGEYVLTFIYSYMDEKDLKALDEMMKTVRFK